MPKRKLRSCQSLSAVFALVLLVNVTTALAAADLSVACAFDLPRLQAVGEYSRVTLAGCEPWQQVGAPVLPFRTVRVLLPPESRLAKAEVRELDAARSLATAQPIEYGHLPVPELAGQEAAGTAAVADGPDPAIYLSPQPYPATRVELASLQRLGGYSIAILRVYPLQYRPMSGELAFVPRLNVELTLEAETNPGKALRAPQGAQAGSRDRVAAFVDNPEMLTRYDTAARFAPQSNAAVYDYLLITKSELVAAFQSLIQLKTQQGLAVKVETVEAITAAYNGRDVPERLRNYIIQAYANWGIRYVLLGGDTTTIPCRYAYVSMDGQADPMVPTDLYYACLDGSWNSDGDGRWGEPNDGEGGGDVDLLAEVYVGRAPVDTAAEVSVFVGKTTRYGTQAHAHGTNVVLLAEFLGETPGGPAQGGDTFGPLEPWLSPYHLTWLDDRPLSTPRWDKADALSVLNASPHLVLLNGHGDPYTLIGLNYPFYRSIEMPDLDELTNGWPFLAYSVGCNVGQFDNDRFSPDAIGEELVKRHGRGAFAAILNSRLGWYDPQDEAKYSGEFQAQFFEQMLNQARTNFGVANQLGKQALVSRLERSGMMTYRFCYYEITLFGDPHLAWQAPAVTPPARQLLIVSAYGQAAPAVGTYTYPDGTSVSCQMTGSPAAGAPGIQYVCTGWAGTGSVPPAGTVSQVSFTLTSDSQLTWLWQTQMWLQASAAAHGSISGSSGWQESGTTTTLTAVPAPYHHFVQWRGDVPPGAEFTATLPLSMDRPRTVVAHFAENVTAQGTPEGWLASFGWTNAFEAAAQADADGDGQAAWQEYVAGTSPVDRASALHITDLSCSGPNPRLVWTSVAGRRYSVWAANEPQANSFVLLTNNLPTTPPHNSFLLAPVNGNRRFFRIGVEKVP